MSRDAMTDATNAARNQSEASPSKRASRSPARAGSVDVEASVVVDLTTSAGATTTTTDKATTTSKKAEREAEKARVRAEREAAKEAEKRAKAEEIERAREEKARIKAEKDAERERVKAAKEAEREAEREAKEAEKARMRAEKLAEREAKEAEKRRAEEEKARLKVEKEAEKIAEREAKEAEKRKAAEKKAKEANRFARFFTPGKAKKSEKPVTPSVKTPEISSEVRTRLDNIVRAHDETESIDTIRNELLSRWRSKCAKASRCLKNRWGARRVNPEVEIVAVLCFGTKKRKRDEIESTVKAARRRRLFDIDVELYERPAFWGTGPFPNRPLKASVVTGRNPFKREADVDYEYDSAHEWEEEDSGESLSDGDEEEDEPMAPSDDDDDGFIAGEDEAIGDFEKFDATAIGDDEETARHRATISMLANRARRTGEALVISSLPAHLETNEAAEDPALLRVFSLASSFSSAPRIGAHASTSNSSPATKAPTGKPSVRESMRKLSADDVVQENLRMLVEFLLKHPSLRVGQASKQFFEEAIHTVAGLSAAAVKRKITEIATYTAKMWIVTQQALKAVGLDEKEVRRLRENAVSVPQSVHKPAKRQKLDESTTLENFFGRNETTSTQELPRTTDSPVWLKAITSVSAAKKSKDNLFGVEYVYLFDADALRTCVTRGAVPDFFVSFLIKSVGVAATRVSFRLACKQLLVSVIRAMCEAQNGVGNARIGMPSQASIEAACHGTALRNALMSCIENAEKNDSLRFAALEIADAIAACSVGREFLANFVSTPVLVCCTDALMKRDESSRLAMRVLNASFADETSIETCSIMRPNEFLKLSTHVAKSIRYPSPSIVDFTAFMMDGLRLLEKFLGAALSSTDVNAATSTVVVALEGCLVSRDDAEAQAWNDATITILNMTRRTASSLALGEDNTTRIRDALNALSASDKIDSTILQETQSAFENAVG